MNVRNDIPHLLLSRLASIVPTSTYAGGPVNDPAKILFIHRTCRFPAEARGGVLGFFTDDYRFECLWTSPEKYIRQFLGFGWGAVLAPDFSTWRDDPLSEQAHNVFRSRWLARQWQLVGLDIIPILSWSDESSFSWAFQGIPRHCPVVATECRTAGGNDEDRRAFLGGLTEGVRQVQPRHIVIYGGQEHAYWLSGRLPLGPRYVLLPSWQTARRQRIREETRQARDRNQLTLFPRGGGEIWADVAVAERAQVGL
jgi:hypothetical protein